MEELKFRYQQLKKAYKRLNYMLGQYKQAFKEVNVAHTEDTENEYMTYRDALITRFSFCYDLTWKFLKLVLKVHHSIEANSPRKVFNDCYAQGIINDNEVRALINMIDARNETAHVYDELRADMVGKKIGSYVDLFDGIAAKCAQYQ